MKMKIMLFLMIASLLVSGCAAVDGTSPSDHINATEQDVPVSSDTTEGTDASAETDPTVLGTPSPEGNPTEPTQNYKVVQLGEIYTDCADPSKLHRDDYGIYWNYEGGEITYPFELGTTGVMGDNGIGILLFVDGQPQAYRTDENPEYAYLHTFYPKANFPYKTNFYFTPLTGQAGDTLEIFTTTILDPDHTAAEGTVGMVQTFSSAAGAFRIYYQQTPPETAFPEANPWLSEIAITYEDTMNRDWIGWSDTDKTDTVETHFYVNGEELKNVHYSVSSEETLSLRFEIWGAPLFHYGLVFYVDNEPVCGADGEPIFVDVQEGKKTVVTAELSLPEFDGESVYYAILVPRNYFGEDFLPRVYLKASHTHFLLAQEQP